MNKIKTVIIINDFDYINGGAAKVALITAEELAKKGLNVYFFSAVHKDSSNSNSKIKFITTNQYEALTDKNKFRGIINGIYNFKVKKCLAQLLDTLDKETTIIHIHAWMKALSSSIFTTIQKKGFKFVVTFHDYFSTCPNGGFFNYKKNEICHLTPLSFNCIKCNCDSRNYMFKIYRIIRQFVQNKIVKINDKINNVISISNFSKNILIDSLKDNINIRHIDNPIDIKKNKMIIPSKNKYFLYVGRLSKEKGAELFCQAISELNYEGIVIGDGNQKEYLESKYPNIKFEGWKNKNEVTNFMKKARALIFPSLCYECSPLTILEALAIGLPCIISDCSAATEKIKNDFNGLIYNAKNVENLKTKLIMCKDDSLVDKLGKNGYIDFWNNDYSKETYVNEIIKFYNDIGVINYEN